MEKLFENNPALATTSAKITIKTSDLLGSSVVITKPFMIIRKASNTEVPQDTSQLSADEAIYMYMAEGDYTVFNTSAGKLKIEKTTPTQYSIYENYIDENTPITKTMSIGQVSKYGTFSYVVGSVSGQITPITPITPINNMRRMFFTNNGNNSQADINFRVGGTVGAHSPAVRRALLRRAQGQYAKGCCDA